jgi:hypothetical protein
MRTVRRLYFYAIALISLEIVLWGLIVLARSIVCPAAGGCGAGMVLAQGLALILVGVPVFLFHWLMAQRFARNDMDERASGLRAAFLYGVLLGTLIPIVQNALALLDRLALSLTGLSAFQAFFGSYQSWTDNLIAMVMNGLVAAYFLWVLRGDWRAISPKDSFADLRRIYRHIWLIYSLVLTIAAAQQLLRFVLSFSPGLFAFRFQASGAHGVVLALVGVPIWVLSWKTIQDSLAEAAERESLLRLGMLYLFSLVGVITVLTSGGTVLDIALRWLFGEQMTFAGFVQKISLAVSIGVPFAGLWAYYGHWLTRTMTAVPDAPRRAGMRRLYFYILSAIGLAAAFTGLSLLLGFVVDAALGHVAWAEALRPRLAISLSTLAVGLPLWLLAWRPMQAEAMASGEAGDHARRSIVRKIYLYLAMFVSVVGGMITAVVLITVLLRVLFGQYNPDLSQSVLKSIEVLFLFVVLGVYHGLTLGRDGRMASASLAEKQAGYPVLVFDAGDGFGESLLTAIRKQAPRLPVTLQRADKPVAKGAAPKAVVLPSDLAFQPPEALRKWLDKFGGTRIVVPRPAGTWVVAGAVPQNAASQASQLVRQLAEGQEIRQKGPSTGLLVVVYIAAGIFGLELLMMLISLVVQLFGG